MEDLFYFIVFAIAIALFVAALPFLAMALAIVYFAASIFGVFKSFNGYYSALIAVYGKKIGIIIGIAFTLFWFVCCLFLADKILVPWLVSIGRLPRIL